MVDGSASKPALRQDTGYIGTVRLIFLPTREAASMGWLALDTRH